MYSASPATAPKPVRAICMARAPVPGQAKLRLVPAMGAFAAAELAAELLRNTLQAASLCHAAAVELCASPAPTDPVWVPLQDCFPSMLSSQVEGDLGARIAAVVARATDAGEWAVVVSADCPVLTAEHIDELIAQLQEVPVAMIPATDGAYVAIACRGYWPELFSNISWSSPVVLAQTLAHAEVIGLTVRCLPALPRIDLPQHLVHLPEPLAHFRRLLSKDAYA